MIDPRTCHMCGAVIVNAKCLSCNHDKCSDCPEYVEKPSYAELEKKVATLTDICEYGVADGDPNRMLRDHRRYESLCLHLANNSDQTKEGKWIRLACEARAFIKEYGGLDADENLIDRCKKAETQVAELQRAVERLKVELAQPWKHLEHWRNPEIGKVECECCCRWALDSENDHKELVTLRAQVEELQKARIGDSEIIGRWQCEAESLRATVASLQWRPITETDLPKAGDEVLMFFKSGAPYVREALAVWGIHKGWTHFRPLNPPEAV